MAKFSTRTGMQELYEMEQAAAKEAKEQAAKLLERAKEAKVLEASGGKWRLEVSTQVLENYGTEESPRWKCKGGNEYQACWDHEPSDREVREATVAIREAKERCGDYFQEYMIVSEVLAPNEESAGEATIREMFEYGILNEEARTHYIKQLREWK